MLWKKSRSLLNHPRTFLLYILILLSLQEVERDLEDSAGDDRLRTFLDMRYSLARQALKMFYKEMREVMFSFLIYNSCVNPFLLLRRI